MKSLLATGFLVLTSLVAAAQAPSRAVEGRQGMVVCVSPPAADVGLAVLQKGGNAVDAAVAVGFALAVTWPEAGNIGGGGFMHVWPGSGKPPMVVDYREMAPAKSTPTMFVNAKPEAFGHLTAGIPGTVRGMELAHRKFGKLPWKDLLEPSVKLAAEGFTVNAALAKRVNDVLADPKVTNAEFIRCYGKNGGKAEKWQTGDTMKLPDLAATLTLLRDRGAAGFYEGPNAERYEKEMTLGGGIGTAADLKNYVARERASIHTTYRGYDVYTPPLPSGGGVIVAEVLNMLEPFELKKHPRFSAETIHLMTEAMRRAFADRARFMGDADFVAMPAELLSKERAKAAGIDPLKASPSATLPGAVPLTERPEGQSTTHYSIIDRDGMAVSNTYTLENSFGSRIVVRGGGYLLNNEMTDFNIRPGVTNRTGTVGTEPNRIAPGKRMLSSMTPTFAAKDGKLMLITGSPGGRTIPNTVLNVLVSVLDYDMDVQAAVDGPRSHHQWFPDRLSLERLKDRADVAEKLRAMGHTVVNSRQGDAHTILIDPKTGVYRGAADRRLDGAARGY